MNRPTIVVHPLHQPGLPEALRAVDGLEIVTPDDGDGVAAALQAGADVLLTFAWQDRYLGPGLRWIQATSAGVDQFPFDPLRERGVVLTTARGTNAGAVALHAVTLLLALVRGVGPAAKDACDKTWRRGPKAAFEVSGWTLGVLGLGATGEEVARLARGLGMQVIGTKARPEHYDGAAEEVYGPADTVKVCERADAVVVTLPANPATEAIVGREALAALAGGWLVNVGRGSVVDEDELVTCLREGRLRGAGLDVVREEPLPASSPLWDLPNVLVTPHMAGLSDRVVGRIVEMFRANLDAYRGGREWVERVV